MSNSSRRRASAESVPTKQPPPLVAAALPRHKDAPSAPPQSTSRRWIPVGIAIVVMVGVGGVALNKGWFRGKSEAVEAGPFGGEGGDLVAEFREVARKLFEPPNGTMSRTRTDMLRKTLEEAGSDVEKAVAVQFELVHSLLKDGKPQEAIDEVDKLFATLARVPGVLEKDGRPHVLRGLAYLRLAEVQNCIERHNDECCVFPLKGGGVHTEQGPAREAAKSFFECLRIDPADHRSRWLLNVTHMALGTYPDGVPKGFLLPQNGPNSSDAFPRFPDVAKECGITCMNHAGGVVMEDLDNDGLLDMVISSLNPETPLAYFHGEKNGTFQDRAVAANLANQFGGLNLVSTDYDNDGNVDLFVLRGGWLEDEGCIRKSLLKNNGNGTFTDVTRAAGLAGTLAPTQVGVWFDFDNDGDLDVFIGNESRVDPMLQYATKKVSYPCNLFRNEGNGTFTDVADKAGVTNDRMCKGATAGDYDGDGFMDLYVSNIGRNRLYHNNKDGTFTDVAEKLGLMEPSNRSFAPWFFDLDNDGDLDIFVGGYDTTVADIATWLLGKGFKSSPPRLYRNKGDGTFEDVTRTYELWRPIAPMGANFGDLDNDGWLDIYLATGFPEYEALMPNVMLRNVEGRHFVDVTTAGGFGSLQKGHGVAFGDLDHDGDQDIFNQLGGFYRGDAFYNTLYENPGNSNHSITLKLGGKRTNRLAYGARIKVVVKTPRGERAIHRAVGSVSSFGGSPSRQEIGVGDATAVQSVEIFWPVTGMTQQFPDIQLDSSYVITEGIDVPMKINPTRTKLGGG